MTMVGKELFASKTGFCPVCGSIFPTLKQSGVVNCYTCKKKFDADVLEEEEIEYEIYFNSYNQEKTFQTKDKSSNSVGPVVERKCVKCGHDKMSYVTLQLRSADEGQTVFYTCVKCKFKDSENS